MYFSMKNYLKNSHKHTINQALSLTKGYGVFTNAPNN
jgi:hypothetical protein